MKGMKEKGRLHIITLAAFLVLAILGLACASPPPERSEAVLGHVVVIASGGTAAGGALDRNVVYLYMDPNEIINIGTFYVTSKEVFNSKGELLEGSPVTYEMLLKKAIELGGEDIANLRIDKTIKTIRSTGGQNREVTYTASCMAIRYKNR